MRAKARVMNRNKPQEGFFDHLLDPIDRLAETIFSILILLTFTLAFRIIKLSGNPDPSIAFNNTNELLIGAIGAILAWGVIDGLMYALLGLFERGERHRLLRNIQAAESEGEAVEIIADELDYILEPIAGSQERESLYKSVFEHLRDSQPRKIGFKREDFSGALGHVVVAIVAVLPSLVPLVLFRNDFTLAIRVSNIVSFIMLFIVGFQWGKYTGANPWRTGLLLLSVAMIMVLIAIPLGG